MMIKPGISELMKDMDSRYTLAMIVAKRARELSLDTTTPLVKVKSDKPVTIAVNEVAQGMIEAYSADQQNQNVFSETGSVEITTEE